ncbi:MAG: hypothetical protein PHQ86_01005 [Dehalococcoidales bacterium]|nr:hypothetical protein [Dehalococcoidales bacterium]
MQMAYTHSKLNEESYSIAGHYCLEKEVRLQYHDRTVLYAIGYAVVDTSCCGVGGCRYALVPGYIINWQKEINGSSLPVSLVETISDKSTQNDITRLIKETEIITQVDFW